MERSLVVDHMKFSYEGLFNVSELYDVISSFFFERNWDWNEKLNQELITPTGRQIRLWLTPWKNISDYYRLSVQIRVHMTDVKEVDVQHNGKNLKINQGKVMITFDAYVISDRKGVWMSPFYWFLTIILEKYFYKDYKTKFETWVKSDIDDLHHRIKNFLNVYKYSYQT